AYDLYLKGHYFWAKRGAANLIRAIAYFKGAIAKDPGFARAHAGLAMVYVILPGYTAINSDSIITIGIQSSARALALDSTLADAHMAMAYGLMSEFKLREARRYFEDAIRLEPGNATAHFWYGIMFRILGDLDGELTQLRRAAELDPLSSVIGGNLIVPYYAGRRMPEAIAQAHRVLEIDSTVYTSTYTYLGFAYLFSGHPDSALLAIGTSYRLTPEIPTVRGSMVLAYAATGRWQDALRVRAEIARMQSPATDLDRLYSDLAFGDWDGALSALERATKSGLLGSAGLPLGCDPLFDPLKASPRFSALMNQLGIHTCKPSGQWPIRVPANLVRGSGTKP
nr:tetratricopeptide repeat protein [Armatimonadota bacterium]